jgi:hypothetical protein
MTQILIETPNGGAVVMSYRNNNKPGWPPPEPFAYMDSQGREMPITELMIDRACEALETSYSLGVSTKPSDSKSQRSQDS